MSFIIIHRYRVLEQPGTFITYNIIIVYVYVGIPDTYVMELYSVSLYVLFILVSSDTTLLSYTVTARIPLPLYLQQT